MINKSNKSIQNSLNDMKLNKNINFKVSNSAYTQARAKLKHTAFIELSDKTVELFYRDGEYNRYKQFRLLAIDGSITILPNSEDIKREFNPTIAKCQIEGWSKEVVQARVSVLFDVLNNIATHSSINNKVNSEDNDLIAYDERSLAYQHLEYCNKDDLVVLDRGYPSYELFARYAKKVNFLTRVKKRTFARANSLFTPHCEHKDIIVELKAPKKLRDKLRSENIPTTLKVRFIQVALPNGEIEVLATSILDSSIINTTEFMELYSKRWGIETYYDVLKNRLSLENFTGLTALAVK